jgi:hypothetical protein
MPPPGLPRLEYKMKVAEINLKRCYRLKNGGIIRVVSVFGLNVHHDVFDAETKKWVLSPTPLFAFNLKELCDDPSNRDTYA